jgi:hypothetical protein
MKKLLASLATLGLFATAAAAADAPNPSMAAASEVGLHRYLIERTFPAGALEGLDAAIKAKVNANNASVGVRWIESYANASKTKTYCIYEGPNEAAIRDAAKLNQLPVDSVVEVPVTLTSQ